VARFWTAVFDFFAARRGALALGVVAVLGLAWLGSARLTYDEDVFELLPRDEPAVVEARLALARFRTIERIVIGVEAPDTARAVAASDRLALKLAAVQGIRSVTHRVDDEAVMALALACENRLPEMFDEDLAREAEDATTAGAFARRLQAFVDRQQGAGGLALPTESQSFRADPFGLNALMMRRFESLGGGFQARLEGGRPVSLDGRMALLLCEAETRASDSGAARALMARIDETCADAGPGVTVHVIGGHRSAADNSETIYRDVALTNSASIAGVLLCFLLAFRGLTPLLAMLVPVSFGFFLALGLQGWRGGSISAITAGFGAAMMGIAGDYAIHLVAAIPRAEGESGRERVRAALGHVSWPVFIAMLTTLVALLALGFSGFAGLRQLAFIAVAGCAACYLFSMVVTPHLLGGYARRRALAARPSPLERAIEAGDRLRRRALWPLVLGCLAVTLALGCGLAFVRLDGDVSNLDGKSPRTREAEAAIQRAFGAQGLRRTLAVTGGEDLEQALRNHEQVVRALREAGALDIESPSRVLPSSAARAANLERWQAFWGNGRLARVKAEMLEARAELRLPEGGSRSVSFSEARRDGFFAAFFASVEARQQPLVPEALLAGKAGALFENFLLREGGRIHIGATARLAPGDQPEVLARRMALVRAQAPGALLLNRQNVAGHVVGLIARDLLVIGGLSLALVVALVLLNARGAGDVLTSLVTVAGALVWTFGGLGWLGVPVNVITVLVAVFIAGLGVDYGIFVVETYRESRDSEDAHHRLVGAGTGVAASALTTLAGFGALTLARHPALFSVGLCTTLGILSSLALSVLCVPSLMDLRLRRAGP
jgi:predicted RND superfamily exporter protein